MMRFEQFLFGILALKFVAEAKFTLDNIAPNCEQNSLDAINTTKLEVRTYKEPWQYGEDDEKEDEYEIDDVRNCILPLHEAGLLNAPFPLTDLVFTGNRAPSYPINDFISNLTRLERLHWKSDLVPPKDLLDSFETSHVNSSLILDFVSWEFPSEQLPGSLAHRKSLRSIIADIQYGGNDEPSHVEGLEKLLYAASDVEVLEIDVYHNGGCLRSGGQPYAFAFDSPGKFPPLKVLKLRGYRFDAISNGDAETEKACRDGVEDDIRRKLKKLFFFFKVNLRRLVQPNKYRMDVDFEYRMYLLEVTCPTSKRERKPNIQKWLEKMDWSRLETIVVDKAAGDVLRDLVPHESWLDKLEYWNDTIIDQKDCDHSGGPPLALDATDASGSEVMRLEDHQEL